MDGWMKKMNVPFFFFSFFVDGLVGGSILALIRFCLLGTYVCSFLLVFGGGFLID